jgi:hypothetical protein
MRGVIKVKMVVIADQKSVFWHEIFAPNLQNCVSSHVSLAMCHKKYKDSFVSSTIDF